MLRQDNISIHAPAKGATLPVHSTIRTAIISIHAPAKGATVIYFCVFACYNISIHAPAKGATSGSTERGSAGVYFNPRSREGSDGLYS